MDHFFFRLFYRQLPEKLNVQLTFLMTEFEPGSSDLGSDRTVNCAPTIAHILHFMLAFVER